MKTQRSILFAAGLLAAAATGSAATIVSYMDNAFTAGDITMNGVVSTLAYNHATLAANVTASGLTNTFPTASANDAGFSTTLLDSFTKSSLVTNTTTPTSSTKALTFSVGPQSGHTLSLTSLTFLFGGQGSAANTTTSNYTAYYNVFYSLDNFATAGISTGSGNTTVTLTTGVVSRAVTGTAIVDLTSITALAEGQTIFFRIALGDNANNTNVSYRIDDLVLGGTVASTIPEPSAYAIVAGALALGLVLVRRRRA